jgi:hypothetical protein
MKKHFIFVAILIVAACSGFALYKNTIQKQIANNEIAPDRIEQFRATPRLMKKQAQYGLASRAEASDKNVPKIPQRPQFRSMRIARTLRQMSHSV